MAKVVRVARKDNVKKGGSSRKITPFTCNDRLEHQYIGSDYSHSHSHDHDPDSPGTFAARHPPLARDYRERAFTVGIGGPVGSGKTALLLGLCRRLRESYNLAVVTNDIFTKEDGESSFGIRRSPPSELLPLRLEAVRTPL